MIHMKRTIAACLWIALIAIASANSLAQGPTEMPKPGPEVKRLGYFVGKWRGESEMKPSPFGPGGKVTESEDVEWMPGGFFVVVHSDAKTPMGDGKTLMILGYNPEKKAYTFNAFDNMGQAETATGTFEGDTWTWLSDSMMGAKAVKSRFTMKPPSPSSYSTKFEMSMDGGAWATVMEGKTTKIK